MNASVLLLIVVGSLALVFVGFLVADYFSHDSRKDRARRKRRRERKKHRKLAMAQSHSAMAAPVSGDDTSDDDHD